ncbi:MAG: ShlB/FhaC/HecB family hemolysin secretion/activation protein [Akkermansiaceae bacterium]|nr:ShlB/FhaC/HecB family hemolysin secretion/activation protein [Akkermansiaceae bacterium]MCP5551778.1 ShlB/FhaC/HecB family hemolysin secretion/activation protein [Akkermansiaceae bacterium]
MIRRLPTDKLVFALPAGLVLLALTNGVAPSQNRPVEKAEAQRAEVLREAAAHDSARDATKKDEPDPSTDRTPLGVDIAQVRLISHQDKATLDPDLGPEKIEIDPAIPAPVDLKPLLEPYLGQPASMGLLADLAKDIIQAWRDSDHPLVDVYFPEQNITRGKVQIVVREAVLGEVTVEGARHSDPACLAGQVRVDAGERINRRVVEADLDWLNENPIRQVNLIYERGEADGTSDIVLQTVEEDPFTVYAGFANTGVNLTGENEWSAGVNWSNPLRTEQSIGYNHGADVDFDTLEAHSLFYRAFLPWRHELRLIGAYVVTDVTTGADPAMPIDIDGESIQATLEYRVPLPRLRCCDGLRHSFTLAGDYKSTNTDLLFGGLSVFDSEIAVVQFRGEYEAALRDGLGMTRLSLGGVWSPGDVLSNNDDASFDLLREDSTADYWYGFAELERLFKLPAEFVLQLRATGQYTDARLTSTEQLLAGGYRSVRGFDENLLRADSGVILNAELISPSFSIFDATVPGAKDRWNLLGFYDAGLLDFNDIDGRPETDPAIQSAGVGVILRLGEFAYARAAYGWVLDTQGIPDEGIPDGKMHFGVTVRY